MVGDEDDFVETVEDERLSNVVDDPAVGFPRKSDRTGSVSQLMHVMG